MSADPKSAATVKTDIMEFACTQLFDWDPRHFDIFWALCQTKNEYNRHLRTAQAGPTSQVPGITYTTCPPYGRLRNLPLYLYLHM